MKITTAVSVVLVLASLVVVDALQLLERRQDGPELSNGTNGWEPYPGASNRTNGWESYPYASNRTRNG
ncbi:hypothetical protein BsWGS_07517 [Bradybaena similaris]